MRVFLVLLLGVSTLFASVSESATNLQTSQTLIQSADAVEPESTHGRLLLRTAEKTDETVDDEERAIMDAAKNMRASTSKWYRTAKNTYDKVYVLKRSAIQSLNIDKTAKAFMKKGFNPDQIYAWLRLGTGNQGHERQVYDRFKQLYGAKHPKWVGKYTYS
ncbi:hypothetical protein PR003_g27397 [Phytophthora rubi]|uniref:RxLR effector protein n=1 Tax=Phytophthora rubi TaxID=129364 RepID=A0A6A4C239_9STRA|nr:hypothetical protein PR002_g27424 [Phytophthora rubi]KAE8975446.1 hypothetical protein PR001_g25699 [Phytophthora rubi]KAE9282463.1 hypothetical protein PR003_g27397 [Phytophthora rubi]